MFIVAFAPAKSPQRLGLNLSKGGRTRFLNGASDTKKNRNEPSTARSRMASPSSIDSVAGMGMAPGMLW
jgi:hypothetical protein